MTDVKNETSEAKPYVEMIARLEAYKDISGKAWNAIAKEAGVNAGSISAFRAGKPTGNVAKFIEKLEQFLELEEEAAKSVTLEPLQCAQTKQAAKANGVLRFCHQHRKIGVVVGEPGLGKTSIFNYYARRADVILVTAFAGIVPVNLMEMILDEGFGVDLPGLENKKMMKAIELLNSTRKILIVDEAQHMKPGLFNKIRHIHDVTKTPVVFGGNNDVVDRMKGKEQITYRQLLSRIALTVTLDKAVTKRDVDSVVKAHGVSVGSDIIAFLQLEAKEGGYRKVINTLLMGMEYARMENAALTLNHVINSSKVFVGV